MKIGRKSTGWFSDLLKGRINLNLKYVRPLSSLFGLTQEEQHYFRLLVEFDQSDNISKQTEVMHQILSFNGIKPEVVGSDKFEFYEKWYHSVLREMLTLTQTCNEKKLAAMLEPPILSKEVKKSLLLLSKLRLICKRPGRGFKPTSTNLVKDSSTSHIQWVLIQKAFIELSLSALERFNKHERDFSSLTLSLSPDGLNKASEVIKNVRKKLLTLSEKDANSNRVYQCNFNIFPVSKIIEENHE